MGFCIDENLSWGTHINELSKKLSRANGVLTKLRYFAPKKNIKSGLLCNVIIWLHGVVFDYGKYHQYCQGFTKKNVYVLYAMLPITVT